MPVTVRGTLRFETTSSGDLVSGPANVEALRTLWLSRNLVNGADLGPGDPGDFDYGAWHVSCHLAGAGGARRAADGRILWLEISHAPASDTYYASVTARGRNGAETVPLDSSAGRALLERSALLGFVEGNSTGRTSCRGVTDPPSRFNRWKRQDFDQSIDSPSEGGKVWEHWCTLRDIRPPVSIAASVLKAYVFLVAALGDRFAPTVARGRRDYAHPRQLRAMVQAGLTSRESALWDTKPVAIPKALEPLFLEAEPEKALEAIDALDWTSTPRYYMFERRIARWSEASDVARDLQGL